MINNKSKSLWLHTLTYNPTYSLARIRGISRNSNVSLLSPWSSPRVLNQIIVLTSTSCTIADHHDCMISISRARCAWVDTTFVVHNWICIYADWEWSNIESVQVILYCNRHIDIACILYRDKCRRVFTASIVICYIWEITFEHYTLWGCICESIIGPPSITSIALIITIYQLLFR